MRRFLAVWAILVVAGCGRSVESETRAWERNTAKIRELKALYPGFETVLQERLKAGEEMWSAAKAIGDEKERANRMAAANSFLMSGYVEKLERMDALVKSVRRMSVDAANRGGDRYGTRVAVEDARNVLDRCEQMLRQGARDTSAAETVVSRVWSDLKSAESNLETALRDSKPTTNTTPTDTRPQPWKCLFCSSSNDPAKSDCTGCGAKKDSKPATRDSQPQQWKCGFCGSSNDAAKSDCKSCGAKKGS